MFRYQHEDLLIEFRPAYYNSCNKKAMLLVFESFRLLYLIYVILNL